ncbi:MAG: DUF3306 domain-containing protein [Rhodoferax sp.]
MTDGFLGRWSRRKVDAREGKPLPEPTAPPRAAPELPLQPHAGVPLEAAGPAAVQPNELPPPLSLEDVHVLTPASNFTPFMESGVAPEVRNAAMKKLFADPHYNVMDGLDTYIDDYTQPSPMSLAMLRKLAGAELLKLADEPQGSSTVLRDDADNPTVQSVAQCAETAKQPTEEESSQPVSVQTLASGGASGLSPADHADTDMRLQPDHATRAEGTRRGAP